MAAHRDDDDPELDDRDLPDESDMDGDDSEETEPCPFCGKPVYDQAEVCPHCRNYISFEDSPRSRPGWLIIGVVICLLIILLVWVL